VERCSICVVVGVAIHRAGNHWVVRLGARYPPRLTRPGRLTFSSVPYERSTSMPAFKLSLLTLAAMAVLTAASLGPASAQPRVIPMVHTQSAGGAEEVAYRYRYRYGYRPYYRRYGYYGPRYRPHYGYPLNLETAAHVVQRLLSLRNKARVVVIQTRPTASNAGGLLGTRPARHSLS